MPTFTVSEIGQFLRCRTRWDFVAQDRQALVKVGAPRTALQLGSLVHKGLEAHIKGESPLEVVRVKAAEQRKELEADYFKVVGTYWSPSEAANFQELVDKACMILQAYFDKWGYAEPIPGYRYVPECTEVTFKVPVPGLEGVYIGGSIDGLVLDGYDTAWIVDHKTYSQTPANKNHSVNFQFNTYMWALEGLLGPGTIGGFIYDGISTKLPTTPKILKNGKVSRAKNINTTPAMYMRAILAAKQDPADYVDMMEFWEEANQGNHTPFHYREFLPINRRMLKQHEANLVEILSDMSSNPRIYPNFRWEGCWDCGVSDLCQAKLYDESFEYMKKKNYLRKEGTYGTTKALKADPTVVNSLDDLIRIGKSQQK